MSAYGSTPALRTSSTINFFLNVLKRQRVAFVELGPYAKGARHRNLNVFLVHSVIHILKAANLLLFFPFGRTNLLFSLFYPLI